MKKTHIFTFIAVVFLSYSVKAEYFSCTFTKPFIHVFASTINKTVVVSGFVENKQYKVKSVHKIKANIVMKLSDGKVLTVFKHKSGSDGMSDRRFPYEVKYGDFWGGCESESILEYNKMVMERLASFRAKNGLAKMNLWPGEYGHVMGYRVKNEMTLLPGSTWSSIKKSKKSDKACTLKKGKYIVPSKKGRGEAYSSIQPVYMGKAKWGDSSVDISKGDSLREIFYLSEGLCLVEHNGEIKKTGCPDISESVISESSGQDYGETFPFGNYAFLKCKEGHYTWVHEGTHLRGNSSLKFIYLEND